MRAELGFRSMGNTSLPVAGELDPFVVLGVLLLKCCRSPLVCVIECRILTYQSIPLALTANVLLVGALMRMT